MGHMRPWRQARPHWDCAAELVLIAATRAKRRTSNERQRRWNDLSFLITLSAIAESQRERQVATGFEDLYFLDLQCFGLFVADAQCNRHKGIVVRLALRAIA